MIELTLSSLNKNNILKTTEQRVENLEILDKSKEKDKIQTLIRKALSWADSENGIDLLPVVISQNNNNDSIFIIDLDQHKLNLDKLKSIVFFATEFIENYNQIILTLDKKFRDKELEWLVGDLPPFGQNASPWCHCQDTPYENSWDFIEIEIINLDGNQGELIWKWGDVELNESSSWNTPYKFRVVKENDKWKISYMEGFDFSKFTQIY